MRSVTGFTYFLLVLICLCPFHSIASPPDELVILTWGDYFDPELQQRFEETYNAKISMVYYSSDESRTQQLVSSDAFGFDLILTSGIDLGSYVKKGWLAPLPFEKIPNSAHLSDRWRNAFPTAPQYAVPYFWGTLGIVYRADLVSTPVTSWRQLFQPAKELQGRIGMMDDSRELVSMGLKALGYSANSEDRQQLKEVENLLLAQKPDVKSYLYISLDETSSIVTGNLVAAMIYNGDALMVSEHHDQLVYVLPEEGSNIWVDYFAVSSKARNPELAYRFLNFINEPQNAAQLAEYVYSATPNKAAEALLPEEFLADPVIYPAAESLKLSEFYTPLPPRTQRLRNNIGAKVLR